MVNKKKLGIAIALLTLIVTGAVFAVVVSQPQLSWNGNIVTAYNPNQKTSMTDIQICVVYEDGEGQRKDFTSHSFDLNERKSEKITAPGRVISASAVTCSVLFGNE
jgi:hypothetical protein